MVDNIAQFSCGFSDLHYAIINSWERRSSHVPSIMLKSLARFNKKSLTYTNLYTKGGGACPSVLRHGMGVGPWPPTPPSYTSIYIYTHIIYIYIYILYIFVIYTKQGLITVATWKMHNNQTGCGLKAIISPYLLCTELSRWVIMSPKVIYTVFTAPETY